MCGILGTYNPPLTPEYRQRFEQALNLLAHRGPDAQNCWHDGAAMLGHTRLSIVDLRDEANQPMLDTSGRFALVFNGEIYDFLELKRELSAAGATFRTDSDSEVILEAYKWWGCDCFARFNGMFALALYDRQTERLVLARDRWGVKPLYYFARAGCVSFGSELKALLALGAARQPRWDQVSRFLQGWGCDTGADTAFSGIDALRPGHFAIVDGLGVRVTRWWDILERRVEVPRRPADRVVAFRDLLRDAVRLRLRNDVDTGVSLSGGMDSSTIYGFSRELLRDGEVRFATGGGAKEFRTFSLSFPGTAVDEYPWVEECLRFWNDERKAFVLRPTPEDFPELIDEVIWHQEAPVWSSSVLAFHALYRAIAEQGVRVILEGHGGDELLAGYPLLASAGLRSFASRGAWWHAWQAAHCIADTCNPALDEHAAPGWLLFMRAFDRGRRAEHWLRWQVNRFRSRGADAGPVAEGYFTPEVLNAHPAIQAGSSPDVTPLGAVLHSAFTERILPIILRVIDRATMAYALESRSPLLDYRVVQFAFSLPDEDIVGRETKHILRAAARDVVPRGVRRRRAKMGFGLAERDWFDVPVVHDYLRDVCHSQALREAGYLNAPALQRDIERCVREGFKWADTTRIWEALNVFLWHERFIRQPVIAPSATDALQGSRA